MTAFVDQEARDLANKAIAMIEGHERVCAERAREASIWRIATTDKLGVLDATLGEKIAMVGRSVGIIHNRMWLGMSALVGVLVVVIGYLISHHGL